MTALVASRHNPILRDAYQRLVQPDKPKTCPRCSYQKAPHRLALRP